MLCKIKYKIQNHKIMTLKWTLMISKILIRFIVFLIYNNVFLCKLYLLDTIVSKIQQNTF